VIDHVRIRRHVARTGIDRGPTERPQRIGLATDADAPRGSDDLDMHEPAVVDLADRHSNDLDVVLLWARRSHRLWVEVTHRKSGRTARIDAAPDNALDVFHHPFAYASVS
jgi:hypothetical protein